MTDPEPIFYPDQEDADWIRDIDDDDLSMSWDEHLHPRGRAGRFARKFKLPDGPRLTRADIVEPTDEQRERAAAVMSKLREDRKPYQFASADAHEYAINTGRQMKAYLEDKFGWESGWDGVVDIGVIDSNTARHAVGQKEWACSITMAPEAVDLNDNLLLGYARRIATRWNSLHSQPGAKTRDPDEGFLRSVASVVSISTQLHEHIHAMSALVEKDGAEDLEGARWTLSDFSSWEEGLVESTTRSHLAAVIAKLDAMPDEARVYNVRDIGALHGAKDPVENRKQAVKAYLGAVASHGSLQQPYTPMVIFQRKVAKAMGVTPAEYGKIMLSKSLFRTNDLHRYRPRIDTALTVIQAQAEKKKLSAYEMVEILAANDGSPMHSGIDFNDLLEEGISTKRLTNEWWEKTFGESWEDSIVNWYNKKWKSPFMANGVITSINDLGPTAQAIWNHRLYDTDNGSWDPNPGEIDPDDLD
jgi:hypothetical protein